MLLGVAHGPGVEALLSSNPGAVDYVELPFEQLQHSPELASVQEALPVVLHCASMSVAGFVPPCQATLDAIAAQAERTRTPWIGEHLAFMSADSLQQAGGTRASATTLTYTVCPQLSEETVDRVADNLLALKRRFRVPLILENSPQYFAIPGSTMGMAQFVAEVALRCDVGLLLDLSHFLITCLNTGAVAAAELERLPLERVVEIHLSGHSAQSGLVWDDHGVPASDATFELLARVVERARPRAVTLEYNWCAFPQKLVLEHLGRVRGMLESA